MIRVDDIRPNPFGVQSTPDTLQADLDKIGTLEQWTTKCGQVFDHDMRLIERVSRLLTEGVKKWNCNPSMGATPATWWILLTAEGNTDKKLYDKLFSFMQFHLYVWTAATTRAWATAYLRTVHDEMNEEGMKEMKENMKAYDELSFGAGRTDG